MSTQPTVWERLAPPEARPAGEDAETTPDNASNSSALSDAAAHTPKRFWRRVRMLDAVALVAWAYLISKSLVDWDRAVVRSLAPEYEWLVNFRLLIFSVAILGLARAGKKLFPLWLSYLVFWPVLLVAWRVPWSLYRRGRWNHLVGLVHVVAGAISSLKSALWGLVLATSSLLCLLLPGSVTAAIALALAGLFEVWLLIMAIRAGVRPSRFLSWQRRIVSRVKSTALVQENQLEGLRPVIQSERQLTRVETDQFLQVVSNALLMNRVTYFWAYRVNEYRKSPALIVYGALSILWLLIGSLASFTVMNLSLYQMDSGNFTVGGEASVTRFVYYSLTSLYSGETDLLTAISDAALTVKILATVTGTVMVMALLVTLFTSYRYTRDEAEARQAVTALQEAAIRLETEFAEEFQLTPERALKRFQALNHGLTGILVYLTHAVPDDFMRR